MIKKYLMKQFVLGILILTVAFSSMAVFMHSPSPEQLAVQDKLMNGTSLTTDKPSIDSLNQSSPRSNLDIYNEMLETSRKDVLSGGNKGKKQLISSNYVVNKKQHANSKKAQYNRKSASVASTKHVKAPVSGRAGSRSGSQYSEKGPIISNESTPMAESNKMIKENSTEASSNHTQNIPNNSFAGNKYPETNTPPNLSQTEQSEDINTVSSNSIQEKEEAPNYSVSIARGLVSGSLNQGTMYLALSINVDTNSPGGLIVKETIPEGWDVVESSVPYDKYNPDTGEIKWLLIGTDIKDTIISYRIVKNDISDGGTLFYGKYLFKDADGSDVDMQIINTNGV